MALQSSTQRSLLFGFIASICACGLVGIYVLATGFQGRLEGQILVTTLAVAAIFLLGLFVSIPTARRIWHPFGPVTLGFLPITLSLSLVIIWLDYWNSPWQPYEQFYRDLERATGASWVIAVAFPVLGLVSIARLKRSFEWIRGSVVFLVLALAAQIIITIYMEIFADEWGRAIGIVSILTTCGLISLPILHRVSAIPLSERVHTAKLEIQLTCPRCGKEQTLAAGGAPCSECSLRITVEIEEEQCRKCGYPLYKINSAVCPECGTSIARFDGKKRPPDPALMSKPAPTQNPSAPGAACTDQKGGQEG